MGAAVTHDGVAGTMDSGKKLDILLSLITQDNDYQLEQASDAQNAAAKLNLNLKIVYAGSDGVTQSLQLLKAIQAPPEERPDLIAVEPAGTSMPQVAEAAARAGIGWVMLNSNADYVGKLRRMCNAPAFCVNADNDEVGRIQAAQFAALVSGHACLLYIEGPPNSDTAQKRRKGMLARKPQDLDVKTLKADWTEGGAYRTVSAWLRLPTSKDLHVAVIGCQNDAMAIGARKAIEDLASSAEREKLLKLPFTGCDGVPSKGRTYVQRGILAATVVTPPLTGTALEMAARTLLSHVQPAEHTLIAPASFPPLDQLAARPLPALT
jgi:ABC-type sugar transport system substrate-binding protein